MRPRRGVRSRSSPAPGRASVVLLNKPYGVLCQFTSPDGRRTLADYVVRLGVYPAGRLDADSEGLVVLTADGALQTRIAELERENRERRRANEILRSASAFFAAEPDRPSRR